MLTNLLFFLNICLVCSDLSSDTDVRPGTGTGSTNPGAHTRNSDPGTHTRNTDPGTYTSNTDATSNLLTNCVGDKT